MFAPFIDQLCRAPFPLLKYPLELHKKENELEETRCIEALEALIKKETLELDNGIASLLVEAIQSEGGDYHASSHYFNKIRNICNRYDILFIVDEVQTGASCGNWWKHTSWNLDIPPDMVTFAKKMQIGLYTFFVFSRDSFFFFFLVTNAVM